jgi:hypothetical protein
MRAAPRLVLGSNLVDSFNGVLWLRGDMGVTDAGGGAVSGWADQSLLGGNHGVQTDPTKRPTFYASGINGLPALWFDLTSDVLVLPTFHTRYTAGEAFVVAQCDADPPASAACLWHIGSGAGSPALNPHTPGTWYDTFGSTDRFNCGDPSPPNTLTSPFIYNAVSATNDFSCRFNNRAAQYSTATNTVGWSVAAAYLGGFTSGLSFG